MSQPRKFDPASRVVRGIARDVVSQSSRRPLVAAGGRTLASNVQQDSLEGSGAGSGTYRNRFQFLDFSGEVINSTFTKSGPGIVLSGSENAAATLETHPLASAPQLLLGGR